MYQFLICDATYRGCLGSWACKSCQPRSYSFILFPFTALVIFISEDERARENTKEGPPNPSNTQRQHLEERSWQGEMGKLIITINGLRKLPSTDSVTGKCDPYVVLKLGNKQFKTKTVKNNLNPNYNEQFSFFIADPTRDEIEFIVYDEDFFTDDKVGAVQVKHLDQLPRGQKKDCWDILLAEDGSKAGEIGYSLFTDEFGIVGASPASPVTPAGTPTVVTTTAAGTGSNKPIVPTVAAPPPSRPVATTMSSSGGGGAAAPGYTSTPAIPAPVSTYQAPTNNSIVSNSSGTFQARPNSTSPPPPVAPQQRPHSTSVTATASPLCSHTSGHFTPSGSQSSFDPAPIRTSSSGSSYPPAAATAQVQNQPTQQPHYAQPPVSTAPAYQSQPTAQSYQAAPQSLQPSSSGSYYAPQGPTGSYAAQPPPQSRPTPAPVQQPSYSSTPSAYSTAPAAPPPAYSSNYAAPTPGAGPSSTGYSSSYSTTPAAMPSYGGESYSAGAGLGYSSQPASTPVPPQVSYYGGGHPAPPPQYSSGSSGYQPTNQGSGSSNANQGSSSYPYQTAPPLYHPTQGPSSSNGPSYSYGQSTSSYNAQASSSQASAYSSGGGQGGYSSNQGSPLGWSSGGGQQGAYPYNNGNSNSSGAPQYGAAPQYGSAPLGGMGPDGGNPYQGGAPPQYGSNPPANQGTFPLAYL